MDDRVCSVKAALRVRPLTAKEQMQNCSDCVSYVPGEPQVVLGSARSYTFDHVFQPSATQKQVYDSAVLPLIDKLFEGYNVTVLAYGQTGSGKTFTMGTGMDSGSRTDNMDTLGIVPRAIESIFSRITQLQEKHGPEYKFELFASFLELYNEELIDLLNPQARNPNTRKATPLTIREDAQGSIYWAGVREEPVLSPQDLLECLQRGTLCRTTGSTDMNLTSSRSHAIYSIIMRQQVPVDTSSNPAPSSPELGNEANGANESSSGSKRLCSKFHFVDLAGSERMKKTKAVGDRAKEGISINGGLLAMGKVIHALNENATHVPYRDSKLTRLLQDSLGGNSQTLMIACVSPSDSDFGETLNTLTYASRARNIRNKVMVNQDFQAMEVHQLRSEIARLKMEMLALRSSSGGGQGMIKAMSSESMDSIQTASLKRVLRENDAIRAEVQRLEGSLVEMQSRINELQFAVTKAEAERDSVLMAQNPEATVSSPTDGTPIHPLLAKYLTTITELRMQLQESQAALTKKIESPMMDRPMTAMSTVSRQSAYTLASVLRKSASKINIDIDSKVSESVEKAKKNIQEEMRNIQRRVKRSPSPRNSKQFLQNAVEEKDSDEDGTASDEESSSARGDGDAEKGLTTTEDQMLTMLDEIQSDIAIKEELVLQLEKTQTDYQVMREKYEDKLKQMQDNLIAVQRERDNALKKSEGPEEMEKIATLKTRFEDKVRRLTQEITDFRKKFQEQQREISSKKFANEAMLKNMKQHIENLKQEKLRMLKRMKEKEVITREKETVREQEISRLKRKERQVTDMAKKLERHNHMQKMLLKRRTEEHAKAQSKLRSVMQLLKKTRPVSSPIYRQSHHRPDDLSRRTSLAAGSGSSGYRNSTPSKSVTRTSGKSIAIAHGPPSEESMTQREEERLKMQATFKRNLLYKEISNYISGKQVNEVAEELIHKRERLSLEKQDLLAEASQLSRRIETVGRLPRGPEETETLNLLLQQKHEVGNRIEIIDAEVKYISSRVHSIQVEAAQAQGNELAKLDGTMVAVGNPPPDMNQSYDNAVEILKSLDQVEAKALLELMTEDFIALKLAERNRILEMQELEKETDDLRKALKIVRQRAIESNLEHEKRMMDMENEMRIAARRQESPVEDGVVSRPTTARNSEQTRNRLSIIADVHNLQADLNDIDKALNATEVGAFATSTPADSKQSPSIEVYPDDIPDSDGYNSSEIPERLLRNATHLIGSLASSQSFPSLSSLNVPAFSNGSASSKDRDRNGNIFERLHREQTISSQAKKKDILVHHALDNADPESLAPMDKLLSIRDAIAKSMRRTSNEKMQDQPDAETILEES